MDFTFKPRYNIDDLIGIVKILRAPDGCPWDKIQTHKTIRNDLLEECYEAVEAIDVDDPVMMREELGDVLLQVVFHSDIESDAGKFTFDDVANDICVKLITRHPHIFGDDVKADTADEVLKNWDSIKKVEKHQETDVDTLKAVSKALPALMRGEKIIKRAYRAGYKNAPRDVVSRLCADADLISSSLDAGKSDQIGVQIGNLLLTICELSYNLKIFPEELLTDACERFIMDFGQNPLPGAE